MKMSIVDITDERDDKIDPLNMIYLSFSRYLFHGKSGLLNNILWSQYIVQCIILFNTILFIVRQKNIVLLFIVKRFAIYWQCIVNPRNRAMVNMTYQITA